MEQILIIQEELEKLFERFFGYRPGEEGSGGEVVLYPEVDIYECEEEIVLLFEVPGVKAANLKVYTYGNNVVVEGVKENTDPPEGEIRYLRAERAFGRFRRVVEVPASCNMRDAKAVLKDGVLRVRLKKVEERRKKKYEIPVEEA